MTSSPSRATSCAQRDDDRVVAGFVDLEADELEAVVGLEPGRRAAHGLEQVLLHARLVDDHVRELRQAVLGVLDAAGAHDPRAVVLVGPPEDGLVDPVGLATSFSLSPNASNISTVRQATPSAWPSWSGPDRRSTMRVVMPGNFESWAASTRPAGPLPTMRTSTSAGSTAGREAATGSGRRIRGSPTWKPSTWNCMPRRHYWERPTLCHFSGELTAPSPTTLVATVARRGALPLDIWVEAT